MRHRRRLALALVSMAATAAGVAFAAPALAADPTADPAGNNGTVKIDGEPVDDDISNEPHVPCNFAVQFFGFDEGQTAKITFRIWSPSGGDKDVLLSEDHVVSTDPAAGGENDLDETFRYSADQLGLDAFEAQENQGYHVKLYVESEGLPGGKKFKVFWIPLCETKSPSSPPPTTPETPPTTTSPPTVSGGGLPVTGAAATTIALTGVALVGGGAALLWLRRRRDNVTFES